ncbi:hypothetical protein E4U13_008114 [Claviceps humidiphila]|uniref:Uncharacterized protein n=1 Tax=Claviceps humidiphila TaxID=1294629 RepID=A0A9P7Q995_9HYPO|nr:hypothetical protein E4U13_008114 [Claviceps humidiphila]
MTITATPRVDADTVCGPGDKTEFMDSNGVAGTHCTQPKAWRNEIPRAKIHYAHAPFLPLRTLLYPPLTSSDHTPLTASKSFNLTAQYRQHNSAT